ncbi:MAG: NADH-quinone oxidoreductase subunit B [Dermatophilaceae bacterium]
MPLDLPTAGLRRRLTEPVREHLPRPVRALVEHLGHRHTLWVLDLPLACCGVEYVAAATEPRPDGGSEPGSVGTGFDVLDAVPFPDDASTAQVLVVSGTVTDAMAPSVRAAYDALSEPRHVISFGACSNTGGPYWDSYSVLKGVDQIVPVDVYVPGCPPRPEALLQGLAELHRIAGLGRRP